MMDTFIIVVQDVKDSSEDKSMLVHFKKAFLLPSVWSGKEGTWEFIWKKSLLVCFESYQNIPYSHTGRLNRGMWTLC